MWRGGGGETQARPQRSVEETQDCSTICTPFHPPLSTLEEVDPLPAVVAVSGEGQGCVHIIRNTLEAIRDVSGEVRLQDTVLKAPVQTTLRGWGEEEGGQAVGCAQRCRIPQSKRAALVPSLLLRS